MGKEKVLPEQKPEIKRRHLTITFRENGDPNGMTLQEALEKAPKGQL